MEAEATAMGGRDVGGADARMTAERDEVKYLVSPARINEFAVAMGKQLPHHRFTGEGANKLPRPRHFVTTIYFDTASRHQFQSAMANHDSNLKMRAKEYYDVHPSLAELATDPRQIVKFQPVLWLELKFKKNKKTGKRRIGIPKKDVPNFFNQGAITPEMVHIQKAHYGEGSEAVLREIAEYCGLYGEPMQADCLVNYRRLPWQDEEGSLRVTLDVGLEFYSPPPDLWLRNYALVRETLGAAKGAEKRAVLEVKARGQLPDWMNGLLERVEAMPFAFSKFEEASRAVHGG